MKKTIAIVAVLAAALSFASAKSYSFTFGAHGFFGEGWGKSWSDDKANDLTTLKNNGATVANPFEKNMLYGGGAFVNLPINGTVGVQPEVNYMVNNAGVTVTKSNLTTTHTVTYNSIDIPVLLTYKAQKFTFLVGPYISIPVSKLNITDVIPVIGSQPDSKEISTKPIFGMAFGANVAERMGGQYLILGARYMLDFSGIGYTDSNNVEYEFTRRGLTLDAGIRFAL